ncbi:MAG: glycosyl hydrolase family 28 protein [Chitinophagaceae bacterium]
MRSTFLLMMVGGITGVFAQQKNYTISTFGAIGDGRTNNTIPIQQAINQAANNGGGTVIIPKGRFVTGALEMKSGVTLHLDQDAILQGSDQRLEYNTYPHPALIYAKDQHDVAITGKGTIDGKGRELMINIFKLLKDGVIEDPDWKIKRPNERTRTNLLYFEACNGIQIRGVHLKDASSWVTHYERCRNLVIDSIHLESMAYWNNDGLDIVDCKNVRVTNSFINAADDAICLKSATRNDYCDSIYISDCTLRSSANAFKIGTGSIGGFKNITIRNLKIYDTYRSAIALEAVDGGFLENIDISNVMAKNTGNAIFIRLGHRNNDNVYSRVQNILIKNVSVEVPLKKPDAGYEMEGPLLKYPKGFGPDKSRLVSVSPWNHSSPQDTTAIIYQHNVFPSSVSGLPGHPVKNVRLENINIVYEGGANREINYFPLDSLDRITEAEKDYPEFSMFGELPASGFYARHVEGLQMKNIQLQYKKPDFRTAMVFNDVEDLALNGIAIPATKALPVIYLHKVTKHSLKHIRLAVDNTKGIIIK